MKVQNPCSSGLCRICVHACQLETNKTMLFCKDDTKKDPCPCSEIISCRSFQDLSESNKECQEVIYGQKCNKPATNICPVCGTYSCTLHTHSH